MAEARDWRVHPDPDTGEVDEQQLNKNLLELGVMLRKGGGSAAIFTNRKRVPENPHELPTERYTESVDIRWMARTDTAPRYEEAPVAEAPAEPVVAEPAE